MATTDDFRRTKRHLQNQLDKLADADIDDRDRAAIRAFLRDNADLALSSQRQYVAFLRRAAVRSPVALVEMDHDAFKDLLFEFRHNYGSDGSGMSQATIANYQSFLRRLFEHLDREWATDISIDRAETTVRADDMLAQEDIAALTDALTHPRDIALVEFLADTGARVGLVGSLRVCDVDLDGERATYTPNPNALGLKDAPIQPYPIIDAKASLRAYIRHSHPRPDEPKAALFHKMRQYDDDVSVDDGVLGNTQFRRILTGAADDAEVDKPVNPHNFRHSAISRMWREGWDKQQIQHRVQWSVDTDMWATYVHLHAEDMNEEIFADAGVVDDTDTLSRERETCGNCRETLPPHAAHCPNCGEPVTKEARDRRDEVVDAGVEQLAAPDLPDEDRQLAAHILRLVRSGRAAPTLFNDTHAESSTDD